MTPLPCPRPEKRCIKFCNDVKLLDKFRESAKLLDMVQKGLSDYLETKRAGFSRFYFLSNDELLEILSQTKVWKEVDYIALSSPTFQTIFERESSFCHKLDTGNEFRW